MDVEGKEGYIGSQTCICIICHTGVGNHTNTNTCEEHYQGGKKMKRGAPWLKSGEKCGRGARVIAHPDLGVGSNGQGETWNFYIAVHLTPVSAWRYLWIFWLFDVWKSQRWVLPALQSLCNTRPYGSNRMSAGGGRIIIGRRDLHQCIIKIIIQRERDSITLTNQRPCLWMAKFVVYLLGADEIIFGLTSLGWM